MKFRPHLTTGTLTAETSEEFQQKLFFVQVCNKYEDMCPRKCRSLLQC